MMVLLHIADTDQRSFGMDVNFRRGSALIRRRFLGSAPCR